MPRYFAVIPAAGNSSRMGAPKLLLHLSGATLLEKTLEAWQKSKVDQVVVIVRPDDRDIQILCDSLGVKTVVPATAPPEMKDSVQLGLSHIESHFSPTQDDAWLLAPADMPNLSAQIVDALIQAQPLHKADILVPTLGGKRGHPVLFPWTLAAEVFSLLPTEGLNVLRQRHPFREIPCDGVAAESANPFADVDTPEDYQQLRKQGAD